MAEQRHWASASYNSWGAATVLYGSRPTQPHTSASCGQQESRDCHPTGDDFVCRPSARLNRAAAAVGCAIAVAGLAIIPSVSV